MSFIDMQTEIKEDKDMNIKYDVLVAASNAVDSTGKGQFIKGKLTNPSWSLTKSPKNKVKWKQVKGLL